MIAVGGLFYNAEPFLEVWFQQLLDQDYDKRKIRLIFIYGKGDDATLEQLKKFGEAHAKEYAEYTLFEINRVTGTLEGKEGRLISQQNICKAYNALVELSKPDDLIIMEQDIEAPNNSISRLIQLRDQKHAGIISGICLVTGGELSIASKDGGTVKLAGLPSLSAYYLDLKGNSQAMSVWMNKINAIRLPTPLINRLIEVDAVATGLSLLTRKVIDRFPFEPHDKRSQDLHFCHRARRAGFRVLVDTSLWYDHHHYIYKKERDAAGILVTLLDSKKTDGITLSVIGGEQAK